MVLTKGFLIIQRNMNNHFILKKSPSEKANISLESEIKNKQIDINELQNQLKRYESVTVHPKSE